MTWGCTRNHVTRAPSQNSSTFIEDGTTTTSTETKVTTDTSPELSTRSRSSRSLSPGPARVKEKERKERERKRVDRVLPPLQVPVPSGYYRHNVATTRMFSFNPLMIFPLKLMDDVPSFL